MHDYTHAVMGIVNPVVQENVVASFENVDIEDLRNEVLGFKRVLQELNLNVIEVPTEGNLREMLMMEDLAIICQGIAVIPKDFSSKSGNRNNHLLQKTLIECGLTVAIPELCSTAKLSPADVLFTGREFFVGITDHTNESGASFIADTFPEFPCTPIKMPLEASYLKKHVTVAGKDVLTTCEDEVGKILLKKIEREASYTYKTLTVPTLEAANCVFVNDTLMHKGIEDIGDSCFKVFCDKIDFPRRSLKFTELTKLRLEPSSVVLLMKLF